jgi:hypothetical protein
MSFNGFPEETVKFLTGIRSVGRTEPCGSSVVTGPRAAGGAGRPDRESEQVGVLGGVAEWSMAAVLKAPQTSHQNRPSGLSKPHGNR